MIQSTVLTPTLPSQDQEKDPVCAKSLQSEKSRQPNHNGVRICKPNMKVLAYICLSFSLPASLPFQAAFGRVSYLSPCRRALPFLSPTSPASSSPCALRGPWCLLESGCPLACHGSLAENLHYKLAQNKHSWLSYEPPEG